MLVWVIFLLVASLLSPDVCGHTLQSIERDGDAMTPSGDPATLLAFADQNAPGTYADGL